MADNSKHEWYLWMSVKDFYAHSSGSYILLKSSVIKELRVGIDWSSKPNERKAFFIPKELFL